MTPKQICEMFLTGDSCVDLKIECYGFDGINRTKCPHAESLRCNEVGSKQASVEWLEQNKEAK